MHWSQPVTWHGELIDAALEFITADNASLAQAGVESRNAQTVG